MSLKRVERTKCRRWGKVIFENTMDKICPELEKKKVWTFKNHMDEDK